MTLLGSDIKDEHLKWLILPERLRGMNCFAHVPEFLSLNPSWIELKCVI